MTQDGGVTRLLPLADLVLDRELARLRALAQQRERSLMQLRALDQGTAPTAPGEIADTLVALRYLRWADAERAELNLQLAAHTAAWLVARDEARQAFGRQQALRQLSERAKAGR